MFDEDAFVESIKAKLTDNGSNVDHYLSEDPSWPAPPLSLSAEKSRELAREFDSVPVGYINSLSIVYSTIGPSCWFDDPVGTEDQLTAGAEGRFRQMAHEVSVACGDSGDPLLYLVQLLASNSRSREMMSRLDIGGTKGECVRLRDVFRSVATLLREHAVNINSTDETFKAVALPVTSHPAHSDKPVESTRAVEGKSTSIAEVPQRSKKNGSALTDAQRLYVSICAVLEEIGALKDSGGVKLDAATLRQIRKELDQRKISLPPGTDWCDLEDEKNWENAGFASPDKVSAYLSNIPDRARDAGRKTRG